MVHSKRSNQLQQQKMNDLVYVMYNLKLNGIDENKGKGHDGLETLNLDDVSFDDEWITKEPSSNHDDRDPDLANPKTIDSASHRGRLDESYEGRQGLDELDEQLGKPDEYCPGLDELDEQLGESDEDYLELGELKEQLGESSSCVEQPVGYIGCKVLAQHS
uniref:Uncharacterized protein n=1 Tax=Lactuca sativa TaxID=4236 RepID=A0A9R1UVH8_LACSA|nr:hypothetical protein LSAT_V11C800393370 [Lactuca sativa]